MARYYPSVTAEQIAERDETSERRAVRLPVPIDSQELTGSRGLASAGGDLTGRTGLERGHTLADRWVIRRRLGSGAMGSVYLASDPVLARDVAIKIIASGQERADEHMLREARAAAKVRHQHIVEVLDFVADEPPFLVMEYVPGRTLRAFLARRETKKASWRRVVLIILQVLEALDAAHSQGVIHRDVKPDNVLLIDSARRGEQVKVVDFGVARVSKSSPDEETATVSVATDDDTIVGTLPYMAPELLMGVSANARSDLFAVGVMLFELLTGERPFRGADLRVQLFKARRRPPSEFAPKLGIPPELDALVLSLLDADPNERPPTALETARRLTSIAKPPPVSTAFPRAARRTRLVGLTLGTIAAGFVAIIVVSSFNHPSSEDEPAEVASQTLAPTTEPSALAPLPTKAPTANLAADAGLVSQKPTAVAKVEPTSASPVVDAAERPNVDEQPASERHVVTRKSIKSAVKRKLDGAFRGCVNEAGIWDRVEVSISGTVNVDGSLKAIKTHNPSRGAELVLSCFQKRAARVHVLKPGSPVAFSFQLSYKS